MKSPMVPNGPPKTSLISSSYLLVLGKKILLEGLMKVKTFVDRQSAKSLGGLLRAHFVTNYKLSEGGGDHLSGPGAISSSDRGQDPW